MTQPTGREMFDAENRRRTLDKLGISKREEREFSLSRAILAVAMGDKPYGFEGEVDAELRRQYPETASRGSNLLVPTHLAVARRDLSTGTASAGGYLVGTDNLGDSFIELLRSRLVVQKMGAQVLSGLVGNVTIPKQTAAATPYWLATDGTAITESQPTLGQLSMSPKTVGAYCEFTRPLLLQSSPSVDSIIANDLAKVIAQAVDTAAISGTGASGQPTGIINTAGIGSVTGTSLDYAGVLEFITDIATANALVDTAKVGFVTTPAIAASLMQRHKVASTYSPLWDGNIMEGSVSGFPAMTSTAIPTASMLGGDFSQLVIGEWGLLEIAVNPYAAFQSGIIGMRAMQSVDVGVRQAGAFSLATSIT
ncbi:MAG TPA: phage major capsid protein [Usitatibacteraceae bacterium]|nr:phage major capsid protein [Usitatibacteraceae bacterium]